MSVFRRGNRYWIELKDRDGKIIRESTGTDQLVLAKQIHERRKIELARPSVKKEEKRTWVEASERFLAEHADKRDHKNDVAKADYFNAEFKGMTLDQLDISTIRSAIEKKRAETSNSTANRYIAFIRSVLRCAEIDWGWIKSAPKFRQYTEPKFRNRFLSSEEITKLLPHLPDHTRDMVEFSLAVGLRQGNVTGLRWDWIDLEKKEVTVPSEEYKNKTTVTLPLTDTAVKVLARVKDNHPIYPFVFRGSPVKSVATKAWKSALDKAGIKNFRWHDLRHTFASHHANNGTPVNVIQALGGWKSAAIVQRYAHLTPDAMRKYEKNSPL